MAEQSASDGGSAGVADLPETCLPTWNVAELPEPKPLGWNNWTGFIGPGIVMCGIQIGGGEWLFGPAITARYGGSLMWIATIAILGQVFYNIECGRYALYTGEPVFTGFMRCRPGPGFWASVIMILCIAALIPGLSTNAAVLITSMYLNHPPAAADVEEGDSIRVVETAVDGTASKTMQSVGSNAIALSETDFGVHLSGTGQPRSTVAIFREDGTPSATSMSGP